MAMALERRLESSVTSRNFPSSGSSSAPTYEGGKLQSRGEGSFGREEASHVSAVLAAVLAKTRPEQD